MHRLFLSVPNIVFSVHSPLSLKDIASNISSDIWRNGMLSGPGLPAWSIEDKTLWFSGAFSRNPLFFHSLSIFYYPAFPTLATFIYSGHRTRPVKVWTVSDRCVCLCGRTDGSRGQEIASRESVLVRLEAGGCQSDTMDPRWGGLAMRHSTGQHGAPCSSCDKPNLSGVWWEVLHTHTLLLRGFLDQTLEEEVIRTSVRPLQPH